MLSLKGIAPYERKVLRRSYPAVTWMSARSWFVDSDWRIRISTTIHTAREGECPVHHYHWIGCRG